LKEKARSKRRCIHRVPKIRRVLSGILDQLNLPLRFTKPAEP
jgi:hypothetical protein